MKNEDLKTGRTCGSVLREMRVESHLARWITDSLTERPQYVGSNCCTSVAAARSSGAPQGSELSPVFFTLYTADFQYSALNTHDTVTVGCIRDGDETAVDFASAKVKANYDVTCC